MKLSQYIKILELFLYLYIYNPSLLLSLLLYIVGMTSIVKWFCLFVDKKVRQMIKLYIFWNFLLSLIYVTGWRTQLYSLHKYNQNYNFYVITYVLQSAICINQNWLNMKKIYLIIVKFQKYENREISIWDISHGTYMATLSNIHYKKL